MTRPFCLVLIAMALTAGLGGCVSAQQLRQQDVAACQSYGFHEGTDAFAACLQRENLARRYDTRWDGPGWGGWGPGYISPPPPPPIMR